MNQFRWIFIVAICWSSCGQKQNLEDFLFEEIAPEQSGLDFINIVNETEDFNILEYLYFYNGGGVAIGDINNDGLEDIFLTSNQGQDKLYQNLGDMKFKDITTESGISHPAGWSNGVNIADINGDGWLDIYICRLGNYKIYKNDYNRVYINDGNGHFTEQSQKLGLHFSGFSTQMAFFDMDRDGDLDAYLLNHSVKDASHFRPSDIRYTKDTLAGDILYENRNGHFVDISASAGIYQSSIGYGLGITIVDINNDGWQDVYVCNDFHENDYLYLNQKNNTFLEVCKESFGHTSNFSMGIDVDDIDDDGLTDIFTADMKPDDETIYKNSGGWENLQIYNFKRSYGYHHQQPKNAFQWNRGLGQNGIPYFSEISAALGVEATDWSWSPIFADFDLDGHKDLFISNGIKRRPNDLDFVHFLSNVSASKGKPDTVLIQSMPEGKVPNCFYRNGGNLDFTKVNWAQNNPTLSNGAAIADLDNDGDYDLIVNNHNAHATLYKNTTNPTNFISLKLKNKNKNTQALGAKIKIYSDSTISNFIVKSVQGFMSTSSKKIIFHNKIDSLEILWPEGPTQKIGAIDGGQILNIEFDQSLSEIYKTSNRESFINLTEFAALTHLEDDYNDQIKESWMPYLLSCMGPKIVSSSEGKGFITQSKNDNGIIFDSKSGKLLTTLDKGLAKAVADETNACFFDANGDGIEDIYVCLGGNEAKTNSNLLSDQLFLQTKDGKYTLSTTMLPLMPFSTSVVRACDYDKDGDVDLFIGVFSEPGRFGTSQKSYLLRNQNNTTYTPILLDVNEMVTDATWTDMDNDGYEDLVICGNWMSITILYNDHGKFTKTSIADSEGLWFSIFVSDVNDDGIKDIIAGNFGNNHSLKCNTKDPLLLYIKDFDNNGQSESLLTYVKNNQRYIFPNRDLFVSQLPAKKKSFLKNKDFAGKTLYEIFSKSELEESQIKTCKNTNSTVFFGSKTKGVWRPSELPKELQLAPIRSIEQFSSGIYAFGGNFYDVDPNIGRQDALLLSAFTYSAEQNSWTKTMMNLPKTREQVTSLKLINQDLFMGNNNSSTKRVAFKK